MNIESDVIDEYTYKTIAKFDPMFKSQPLYYEQNEDQTTHVVVSDEDSYYYNSKTNAMVDLD
jgi:hypothetical protein